MVGLSSPMSIRLPHLPLLYWDNTNLARVASFFGKPLWVDAQTNSWGRNAFARVCVRMDRGAKFPPGVWISGLHGKFFQRVEYEGISHLCYHCGLVGHKISHCPNLPLASKQPLQPQSKSTDVRDKTVLCKDSNNPSSGDLIITNSCPSMVIIDPNPSFTIQSALHPPHLESEHSLSSSAIEGQNYKSYG
ncbi:hypothetical protein M5K25_007039 [Dendrobium thyrsiflorum]|uniref:CCHC-type domain-containing protein n=1 Tax=Dendrobium thyrsiflorum TaxID=117978 RepID=A0ABD0VD70_DENTH